MLQFKNILRFPPKLQNRNSSVFLVKLAVKSVIRIQDDLKVVGFTGKYSPTILMLDYKNFTINSNVKISCDCESFKYEFINPVKEVDGLYLPEGYDDYINTKPKEKNKFMTISGCKHIIKLATIIQANIDNFKFKYKF